MKKIIAVVVLASMLITLCSCGSKNSFSVNEFREKNSTGRKEYVLTENQPSERLVYNAEKVSEFQTAIKAYRVEYGYDELFDYEKAIEGIRRGYTVTKHRYSALDENGKLTPEHLYEIVLRNNEEYMEHVLGSIVKKLDKRLTLQICRIITDVITEMLEKYPDIDKDRVYCNLGNLKIVEKLSAINYGAVEPGMVLHINRSTAALLDSNDYASMYNVIVHETMHIIQFGCECEEIEDCVRRFGPSRSYGSRKQDYSDWTWLGEGSAERMTCLYIGTDPMTYFNHINYILSFDLTNVTRDEVPANYIESLYFYDDLDKLFFAFDAVTEEEKQEIYKMIYSLEIMQAEPDDIKTVYEKIYGVAWTEAVSGDVFNKVKRPILKSITKRFYANLAEAVLTKELSKNDVMFLINMYESTINQHLLLDNSKYNGYNSEFVRWYREYRGMLFDAFDNLTFDEYMEYVAGDGETAINATLACIPEEKRILLMEKYAAHMCRYKMNP